MKNFTLFFSLFLVIAFTSCEKESTTMAFDLDGDYEATLEKTTVISNATGVLSEKVEGEVFQISISGDSFSRTDKVANEQTLCDGKLDQRNDAVYLTMDQCNGTSIAGRYNYNLETKTLTRSIQTSSAEEGHSGNCGNDEDRVDTPITRTIRKYTLQRF